MSVEKLYIICLYCSMTAMLFAGVEYESRWGYYDADNYEERVGGSFSFLVNPKDDVYALSLAEEGWIRRTPVFGGAFIAILYNGIETNWYSSLGCTIRIMPHWMIVPFIGTGGAYNLAFSSNSNDKTQDETYYWSAHVEAGFRLWFHEELNFIEILGRYTWSSRGDKHDYWFVGLATRPGL